MALELNLKKSDNDSWGFRLTGGAEYDVPLIVVKVTENSIAEKAGLQNNDIIVRVNDTPTTGLTHPETHDLLIAAGNYLTLAVRRDLSGLCSPTTYYEDENNEEISKIMQASLESEELLEHERHVHFELVNFTDDLCPVEDTPCLTQVIPVKKTQVSGSINPQNASLEEQERKWSTFLQKPKNPKPVEKKTEEIPKGEPYRVIIKKQKKKVPGSVEKTSEETSVKEKNIEKDSIYEDITPELNTPNVEEEITFQAEIKEEEEEIIEIGEDKIEEDQSVTPEESLANETNEKNGKNVELEKLLEEKLADVQKQLEALAKLPSTIQSTIDAVTKQIASIVRASTCEAEKEEKIVSEITSEQEADFAEQEITEEGSVSSNEVEENFEKERQDTEEEVDKEHIENDHIESEYVAIERDTEEKIIDHDPEAGLTEEEKENRRIEQELMEKQQKEQEIIEEFKQRRLKQKPTLPLKPIDRPIILPGGRRWSQPDDACAAIRHPKMTDEKISNTIETYSEVIVGKTKGLTTGTKSGHGPTKKKLSTGIVHA